MVQYFAVFLVFSFSGGSLGTTTSPQQQNTAKLKDLCEVRNNYSVLADIFGSRAVGGKENCIKKVCTGVYIGTIKMPASTLLWLSLCFKIGPKGWSHGLF